MIRMWVYILGNANSAFMKQCLTKKYALGMKAEVFTAESTKVNSTQIQEYTHYLDIIGISLNIKISN